MKTRLEHINQYENQMITNEYNNTQMYQPTHQIYENNYKYIVFTYEKDGDGRKCGICNYPFKCSQCLSRSRTSQGIHGSLSGCTVYL